MFGLKDINDPNGTNSLGIRIDETTDDDRTDYTFENTTDPMTIGRAVGYVLWEARGIDIIIVGVMLLVASEAAATVVKGIEDQCGEFRQQLCETDKFIILEEKAAEECNEEA